MTALSWRTWSGIRWAPWACRSAWSARKPDTLNAQNYFLAKNWLKTPNFDRFWAFSVDFSWHRELEKKEKRKISVAAARAWLDGFGISFDEGGVWTGSSDRFETAREKVRIWKGPLVRVGKRGWVWETRSCWRGTNQRIGKFAALFGVLLTANDRQVLDSVAAGDGNDGGWGDAKFLIT